MTLTVHFETLKSEPATYVVRGVTRAYDRHTVEISINGDRRVVSCGAPLNGGISIYGLAVRFSTGAKVWPGSAIYWLESGRVNNLRPNIDKRGEFSLVGFMSDYENKNTRSRHNAVA